MLMNEVTREAFLDELEKIAGVLGALATTALKSPFQTAGVAAQAIGGVAGSKGKYKQFKTGFDPQVQNAMLGQTPIPPSV